MRVVSFEGVTKLVSERDSGSRENDIDSDWTVRESSSDTDTDPDVLSASVMLVVREGMRFTTVATFVLDSRCRTVLVIPDVGDSECVTLLVVGGSSVYDIVGHEENSSAAVEPVPDTEMATRTLLYEVLSRSKRVPICSHANVTESDPEVPEPSVRATKPPPKHLFLKKESDDTVADAGTCASRRKRRGMIIAPAIEIHLLLATVALTNRLCDTTPVPPRSKVSDVSCHSIGADCDVIAFRVITNADRVVTNSVPGMYVAELSSE